MRFSFNGILKFFRAASAGRELERLQTAEEKFRAAVGSMLDCFGIFSAIRDASGRIVDFRFEYLNEAALANNRMTEQDLEKTLLEWMPSHQEAGLLDLYAGIVETGKPLARESVIYGDRFNGEWIERAFDLRGHKLGDGFAMVWRDVTSERRADLEVKRAHEALKQANFTLNGIINGTKDLIAAMDVGFRFSAVNSAFREAMEKVYGVRVETGVSLLEALKDLPEERQRLQELWARALRGEEFETAGEYGDANRERKHYQMSFSSMRGENGELLGASLLARDVTLRVRHEQEIHRLNQELELKVAARTRELEAFNNKLELEVAEKKAAIEALRESEARFRQLADTAPQMVWTADPDGWVDYYNLRWFEYTGMTLEQSHGWDWREVVHPEDLERTVKRWKQSVHSGDTYEVEYRLRRISDGTYRWHLGRALPVRDAQGRIVKWFGTCTDIDDQKRSEDEKMHALSREQAALEASRLKSEFLANMSHEIRTPINGVIGMASLLAHTRLTSEQKEYTDGIVRSADSLLTVVNDILDFSKVEAGRLDLEIIEFDLARLLLDIEKSWRISARNKGLRFVLEAPVERTLGYFGDPGKIRQVITNLVSNAVKFTDRGKIVVRVVRETREAGMERLRFEVEDTGMGIPLGAVGKLFQPFSQADSSMSRKFGGTGLGLSICKRLVELMGGEIGVQTAEGKGSTFWFSLQLKSAVSQLSAGAADHAQAGESQETGAPGSRSRGAYRILVAEDNPVSQLVTVRMVEKLGYRADGVTNGAEALDALKDVPYDLILMDCQMPIMDGYETATRLRATDNPTWKNLPIVALTAHAIKGDREKCLAAGMSDYVSKPVTIEDLEVVLGRWLEDRNWRRDASDLAMLAGQGAEPPADSSALDQIFELMVMDRQVLDSLRKLECEGGSPLIRQLVSIFVTRSPERISRMEVAFGKADWAQLAKDSHAMKGACLNLGTVRLGRLCAYLEEQAEMASPQDGPRLRYLLDRVHEEFVRAREALEQEITNSLQNA